MYNVAVYGSLRQGFGNHRLLEGQTFLNKTRTTERFSMFSLGGFPYVDLDLPNPLSQIVVETYQVTPECLKRLDILEGYPRFYNRTEVTLEDGNTAWIYHIRNYNPKIPIPSGDWAEFKSQGAVA